MRAVSGDKTAFAYSDDISLDALNEAAVAARSIARQGAGKVQRGAARSVAPRPQPALYGSHDPVASLGRRREDPDARDASSTMRAHATRA